ncbi:MAG: hypothetical protein L0Y54_11665, partial [Sporichthyaceae bacterium]|nr:hypothetical protein [Sporichthyaceae bacterium]
MLESIVVSTRQTDGSGHDVVSRVWLGHQLPSPGTALWLDHLRRDGVGSDDAALPVTDFDFGTMLSNRVDHTDGKLELPMPRVTKVYTETGGRVDVVYSGQATPDPLSCPFNADEWAGWDEWYQSKAGNWVNNTELCYPIWYAPEGETPKAGIFHKYVVRSVTEVDRVGGSPDVLTSYDYSPGSGVGAGWAWDPDWHKSSCDDPDLLTDAYWSDFRGFEQVRVTTGSPLPNTQQQVTTHTFFRGMDGDPITYCSGGSRSISIADYDGTAWPDHHWLRNQPLQVQRYRKESSGSLTELSSERYQYWWPGAAADGPDKHNARTVRRDEIHTRTRLLDTSGNPTGWRTATPYEAAFEANEYGREDKVIDWGDDALNSDNTCVDYSYAAPQGGLQALMVEYRSRGTRYQMSTGGTDCVTGITEIARTEVLFDGATLPDAQAVNDGNPTESRTYLNSTDTLTAKATYDGFGRVVTATDGRGKTTGTSYSPATGWPHNGITTTNPLSHATITWLSPRFGLPTKIQDPNSKVTELDYDTVGRLLRVWRPTEPRAGGSASAKFTYT